MMTFTITHDLEKGAAATEALRNRMADRVALNATVETAAALTVRRHLTQNYASKLNKLGGASTGYWRRAIEGTTSDSNAEGATVAINQIGIRLKWSGGTITAGQSGRVSEITGKVPKFLTIPVHPAAHGKTIADFGGKEGTYIVPFGAGGGLKEGGSNAGAGVFRKTGGNRTDTDPLYWVLKRSVMIKPDKQILPPLEAVSQEITAALQIYFSPDPV